MKQVIVSVCHALLLVATGGCVATVPSLPQSTPTVTVAPAATSNSTGDFPDVLDAQLTRQDDGTFNIAVTISSTYDTPARYADGWRVLAPDGTVLGEHTLLHDHANEQPFTRTQRGVVIPSDLLTVTVEGRDLLNGYGGTTLTVEVP
jgi:hypothetical protein